MNASEMAIGVREGDVISGKYRVDKVLGAGGMGVVVAAHHLHLDERVAIKLLAPEVLGSHEAVTRFAREARAAVKIKSEHVVRVIDVGTLDSGAPYMVMEYLEGSDLADWLAQRGPLPIEQAVEFVLQACEAIAEAHALGIVHRDLKPANLFLTRRPDATLQVKVLDFGISKLSTFGKDSGITQPSSHSAALLGMTKTAALMGSPLYMSPEQLQSAKDVDARTDIWALGVTLYELLAGVCPFVGDAMPAVVLKIASVDPAPLRSFRPDAPDELGAVIQTCLEKDRGRRFETVGELALALFPFGPKRAKASVERISGVLRAAGLSATGLKLPPSSDAVSEQAAGAGTAGSWGRTAPGPVQRRTAVLGAAGTLLAAGVGLFAWMQAPSPAPATGAANAPAPIGSVSSSTALTANDSTEANVSPTRIAGGTPSVTVASAQPVEAPASAASTVVVRKVPLSAYAPKRPSAPPPSAPEQPAQAPKKNCDRNFFLDAQGEKHFKPECF